MFNSLKRIFRYFFPSKKFFSPIIKKSKDNEMKYVPEPLGKVRFFEPVTPKEMFDKTKNMTDFIKIIDKTNV